MVSRWRTWEGSSHVDCISLDSEKERETSDKMKFIKIDHNLSWSEFHKQYRDGLVEISNFIENYISEELTKFQIKARSSSSSQLFGFGTGRAELLKANWNTNCRRPGHVTINKEVSNLVSEKSTSQSSQTLPDWVHDSGTLRMSKLPQDIELKDLKGIVESFGEVILSHLVSSKGTSTCYLKMKEPSTCEWVISYFQGRPFDEKGEPIECCYTRLPKSSQC